MKSIKIPLAVGLAVAIGGLIGGKKLVELQVARESAPPKSERIPNPTPSQSQPMPLVAELPAPAAAPLLPSEEIPAPIRPIATEPKKSKAPAMVKQKNAVPSVARVPKPKEPIQDPLARIALSYVGADPDANEYWIEAINNPSLSAEERQDLIEDLNEDGLSDPRNPSLDDMPLIVSRLMLIEELAFDAMDEVNWDAFLEAYKDLANMVVRLTEQ